MKKTSYNKHLQNALKEQEQRKYELAAKSYLQCANHSELSMQEQTHHILHAAQCFEHGHKIHQASKHYLKAAISYHDNNYLQHSISALKAYLRITKDKKTIDYLLVSLREKGLQDTDIIDFISSEESSYQHLIHSENFSQSFFHHLETFEEFQHVMKWMSIVPIEKGQHITQIDQQADCLYFIMQGQVEVLAPHQDHTHSMGYLSAMAFFGETEFFIKKKQKTWLTQTTATTHCLLLRISFKNIIQIKHYLPSLKPMMATSYCHRMILHRLAVSPLFSDLEVDIRTKLSKNLSLVQLLKGEYLFQEDDQATHTYIMISGQISLSLHINDYDVPFKEINANDLLGEIAIINQNKRTATAIALEESYLLAIPCEIIHQLHQQHPELYYQLCMRKESQLEEVQTFIHDKLSSVMAKMQLESQLKDIQNFIQTEL